MALLPRQERKPQAILEECGRQRKLSLALVIYEMVMAKGYKKRLMPTYRSMIDVCAACQAPEEALHIYEVSGGRSWDMVLQVRRMHPAQQ